MQVRVALEPARVAGRPGLMVRRLVLGGWALMCLLLQAVACDDASKGGEDADDLEVAIDLEEMGEEAWPDFGDVQEPDFGDATPDYTVPEEVEVPDALRLEAIAPAEGSSAGGYQVSLRGTGFSPAMEVYFGNVRAPEVVYVGPTALRATVPGNAPGCVAVMVAGAQGSARLDAGFCYRAPLAVHALEPSRSPVSGGVPFVIRGSAFSAPMWVSVGGRGAIDVQVLSEEMVSAVTPPATAPGTVDVRVVTARGALLVPEAVTYFVPPAVDGLFPGAGPEAGGTEIVLTGRGFDAESQVFIGGRAAVVVDWQAERLTVLSPAHSAGAKDVVVTHPQGQVRRPGAFHYFHPSGETRVVALYQAFGPAAGGNLVQVLGEGLDEAPAQVWFGGVKAGITATSPTTLAVLVPAGSPGWAALSWQIGAGAGTLEDAYRYLPDLRVTRLVPSEGPVAGGTMVQVEGEGLSEVERVYLGPLPAAEVAVEGAQALRLVTPPGSAGAATLRLMDPWREIEVAEAFVYTEALRVYGMWPRRGAQAGGTWVSLAGQGFAPGLEVDLAGVRAAEVEVVDAYSARFLTPPHAPAVVEVVVRQGTAEVTSPETFTYFDPNSAYGGAWGDGVLGAVNVTVRERLTNTALPGALVQVGLRSSSPYRGLTDAQGQITFSGLDLQGPQDLFAGLEGFSSASIQGIDAENVTLYLRYQGEGENGNGDGNGNGEAPREPEPSYFWGNVSGGEKVSLQANPNEVRAISVAVTQRSPYTVNPRPGDDAWVWGSSGSYELQTRTGDVAVVALCGRYNLETERFTPEYIGMERFLFVTEGVRRRVDLRCTVPLDQQVTVFLEGVPLADGVNRVNVLPYLNLGPEGYFGGYFNVSGSAEVMELNHMLALKGPFAEMDYYFFVGAYTDFGAPYSIRVVENVRDLSSPLRLGPMMAIPQMVSPQANGGLTAHHYAWTMRAPAAVDYFVVELSVPGVSPRLLWEVLVPGQVRSFDLVTFDTSFAEAPVPYRGDVVLRMEAVRAARAGFDFDNFSLLDLRSYNRAAWSYRSVPFVLR